VEENAILQPMSNRWIALVMLTATLSAQQKTPNLYFFVDANGFSANGRWVPADSKDKAAYPSETEIDCIRETKKCIEATADYSYGHPHVTVNYYDIVKWDGDGIIATSSALQCTINTIIVSFPSRNITEKSSLKKLDGGMKDLCKFFKVETETSRFIIKNSDQWNADPYGESLHKF
jgi:hypothetical protein